MHMYEFIEKCQEYELIHWPMTKVFVLSEEEHLVRVFRLDSWWDEHGNPIIIIE